MCYSSSSTTIRVSQYSKKTTEKQSTRQIKIFSIARLTNEQQGKPYDLEGVKNLLVQDCRPFFLHKQDLAYGPPYFENHVLDAQETIYIALTNDKREYLVTVLAIESTNLAN